MTEWGCGKSKFLLGLADEFEKRYPSYNTEPKETGMYYDGGWGQYAREHGLPTEGGGFDDLDAYYEDDDYEEDYEEKEEGEEE